MNKFEKLIIKTKSKKSSRILLILLVIILVLLSFLTGSYFNMTTFICKDKTSIEKANSLGFKMYSNNEINSSIKNDSFQQVNGAKVSNDSIVKNFKAKFTTETTTSYACIIPFFNPISFNAKVYFSWSLYNKTGIVKSYTDKFLIQGKLKFFGYRSKGNCQRLIRQNVSKQVEDEIKKNIELKMRESK